jgi:deazaflavin-dependent oxidoreductase (nitroreductase family)
VEAPELQSGERAFRLAEKIRGEKWALALACFRRTVKEIHMSTKPPSNDALKNRLSRLNEITITVTGRKSGRTISIPVWFISEDNKLYLLPVTGSDTQWYKNVLKNPSIQIDAGGAKAELKVALVKDPKQVSSIVEKFRAKYGASDVKKYYSKFDVAVLADLQ